MKLSSGLLLFLFFGFHAFGQGIENVTIKSANEGETLLISWPNGSDEFEYQTKSWFGEIDAYAVSEEALFVLWDYPVAGKTENDSPVQDELPLGPIPNENEDESCECRWSMGCGILTGLCDTRRDCRLTLTGCGFLWQDICDGQCEDINPIGFDRNPNEWD